MKTPVNYSLIALALLALSTFNSQLSTAFAQGTAFTYQARLNASGNPAGGSYDFRFTLFATNVTGSAIAGPVTNTAVTVTNGLFTVLIDFGAGAFTGGSNWLEIAVSTNGAYAFITLLPRQQVTPTPYAITAENVVGLTVQQNTNGSPNVIEGSSVNYISNSVYAATIGGGGTANFSNSVTADFGTVGGGGNNIASGWASTVGGGAGNIASSPDGSATVGGGYYNTASGDSGTVGGGDANTASGPYATVGGGASDTSSSYSATVGGGQLNTASGEFATVGGGYLNTASGYIATVGGGAINTASGQRATVGGGFFNTAAGDDSFAAGYYAQATNNGTFVWSDDSTFTPFASAVQNEFAVRANGGVRFVTSGAGMTVDGQAVVTTNAALRSGGNAFTGSQTFTGGNLGIGTTIPGYPLTAQAPLGADVISWGNPSGELGRLGVEGAGGWMGLENSSVFKVYVSANGTSFFNGGNVGIGTTSPQAALHVRGADAAQFILQNSADNSSWYFSDDVNDNLVFQPNTGVGAYIDRAGNYHNNSDVRLKQDITPLGGVLDRVLQLRPVSYHFRTSPDGTPLTFGLIAQEVEPLFPEVVGEHAGMKSLAYTELVPVTIGAIQELNQKLEDQLKQQQAENAELKQRLDTLEKIVLKQKSN